LIRWCLAAKQYPAAETYLLETLDWTKARTGNQSLATASVQAELGECFLREGKYIDADRLLRESLQTSQQKEPDAWTTARAKSLLGGALIGQKKFAEAEPVLREGYEGLHRAENNIPASAKASLTEAGERIIRLYDAWGRSAEAAEWRRKLASAPPVSGPDK
jgi:hypothetical protein